MNIKAVLCFFILLLAHPVLAQSRLDVGIRLQKSIGLYTENGLTMQYRPSSLLSGRVGLGVSYVTSRLGTALNSNAIKQDNFLLSAAYHFAPKWSIQPMLKANVGYFNAAYDEAIFNDLPQSSLLASPEIGFSYASRFPLGISASVGYNLLTGNGINGPGTLYPVFVQTSITWNLLKKSLN